MLSELCKELKNWFNYNQPKIFATFEITNGEITDSMFTSLIQDNQYFRIVGSVFNDGVHQYTSELELTDETFTGAIWLMAIPKTIIDLAAEISDWKEKYTDTVNSPFQSESFGGYSYSKASGGSSSGSSVPTWQSVFATQLNEWRKI